MVQLPESRQGGRGKNAPLITCGNQKTSSDINRPIMIYPYDFALGEAIHPSYKSWSGRRDSNPRHQPWQGCTLPTELRPHQLTTTSVEDRCNGVNGVISPVGITHGLRSHDDSCVSVGFTGGRKNGTRSGTHAIHLKTALKGNCEVGKKMPQWGLTSKPLK